MDNTLHVSRARAQHRGAARTCWRIVKAVGVGFLLFGRGDAALGRPPAATTALPGLAPARLGNGRCPPPLAPVPPPYLSHESEDELTWGNGAEDSGDPLCSEGELCTASTPPHLVFDPPGTHDAGSLRYRTTADALPADVPATGLAALAAAGSSQFSAAGLRKTIAQLQQRGLIRGPQDLVVLDLRKEPHGFTGGVPISWHVWSNGLNKELTPEDARRDETQRLAQLQQQAGDTLTAHRICKEPYDGGKHLFYQAASLTVAPVLSEAEVAAQLGVGYVRMPMTDHTGAPTEAITAQFVDLVRRRPTDTWWYFHCRQGVGRTTLFLAMLDMLHNARDVSLEDIAARQQHLGGVNILAVSATEPEKSRVRIRFVKAFYARCGGRAAEAVRRGPGSG